MLPLLLALRMSLLATNNARADCKAVTVLLNASCRRMPATSSRSLQCSPEAGTEVQPHAGHREKGRNASHRTRNRDVCLRELR